MSNNWNDSRELNGVPMDATASPIVSFADRKRRNRTIPIPDISDPFLRENVWELGRERLRAESRNKKLLLSYEYNFRDEWRFEAGVVYKWHFPVLFIDKKVEPEDDEPYWVTMRRDLRKIDWETVQRRYVKSEDIGYPKWRKGLQTKSQKKS